jgi:DNA-directed RNA polymerase subunit RPC12/RpoP
VPVKFACPRCSRRLSIARRKVGAEIGCPACGQKIIVPSPLEGEGDTRGSSAEVLSDGDLSSDTGTTQTAIPSVSDDTTKRPDPPPEPVATPPLEKRTANDRRKAARQGLGKNNGRGAIVRRYRRRKTHWVETPAVLFLVVCVGLTLFIALLIGIATHMRGESEWSMLRQAGEVVVAVILILVLIAWYLSVVEDLSNGVVPGASGASSGHTRGTSMRAGDSGASSGHTRGTSMRTCSHCGAVVDRSRTHFMRCPVCGSHL